MRVLTANGVRVTLALRTVSPGVFMWSVLIRGFVFGSVFVLSVLFVCVGEWVCLCVLVRGGVYVYVCVCVVCVLV